MQTCLQIWKTAYEDRLQELSMFSFVKEDVYGGYDSSVQIIILRYRQVKHV